MRHLPARVRRTRNEVDVGVGVISRIFSVTIADLEVGRHLGTPVDEMVTIFDASRKTGAHPGRQHLFARVRSQDNFALEDVDQLILRGMPMTQCRNLAGEKSRAIDADLRQAERVAQSALFARHHL